MEKSAKLFERAEKVIPGGVNSPVRAFRSVGGTPRFLKSGKGAYVTDVDGKSYLDFVSSWGPMITGHGNEIVLEAIEKTMKDGLSFGAATELEVEMAEFIVDNIPEIGMIRMVNSGTEAVMSALRLARGFTKREKIVKFEGCYHGHCDSMLVKAGSGALSGGQADSAGVSEGTAKDTLTATYNDISSVREIFSNNSGEIACVIVEPVAANMGVIPPGDGFLEELRELTKKEGALLIFDEVITGFRLGFGGAQGYFAVEADLVTYGKIIGGGLPVGAYGGKKEIMEKVAPLGDVYQAGTLSGNPLAMSAGLACLKYLHGNPQEYMKIESLAFSLADGLRKLNFGTVNQVGSLVSPFFTKVPVVNLETAKTSDTQEYAKYFSFMLEHGVYLAPSQFEAMFLSTAHSQEEVQRVLDLASKYSNNGA